MDADRIGQGRRAGQEWLRSVADGRTLHGWHRHSCGWIFRSVGGPAFYAAPRDAQPHRLAIGRGKAPDIVGRAIREGYRSIDTAAIYGNEAGVGREIRDAEVARDDLFVTTKVWNDRQGRDATLAAFDASLARLGLDRVDLYLIHWPCPQRNLYVETWWSLIELRASGRARSIGVANFSTAHRERIVGETGVVPAVNQIELHPHFQQSALRAAHARLGIATESWSRLGQGRELTDPVLAAVGRTHGRSPAQMALRWHVQSGRVAIPKAATPARIAENIAVFGFALDDEEITRIAGLDSAGGRIRPDPETFG